MSPRKPAVLRDGGEEQNLRGHLIATAARLIDQRGTAGLAVRDIAREAKVADGALYNYFEDKEDLLAHALLAHVGAVMNDTPRLPPAGTGTVAENLRMFIEHAFEVLKRVTPAFAGLMSQPKVLTRFHAMIGGDAAFGNAPDDHHETDGGPAGLPEIITDYLRAEQQHGRIDPSADVDAAAMVIVGVIHGQVLPRVLFNPTGSEISISPDVAARLATTILHGIAPGSARP
jgi:AcrR family transcriptional regulator